MSEPNYAYCACYCPGKILNCDHYEAANKFGACKTYKLLEQIAPERHFRLSRTKLEKIVEVARRGGR